MNIQSPAPDVDFHSSLTADSASPPKYFETAAAALKSLGAPATRGDTPEKTRSRSRYVRAPPWREFCAGMSAKSTHVPDH